jgi:hypothetical protein
MLPESFTRFIAHDYLANTLRIRVTVVTKAISLKTRVEAFRRPRVLSAMGFIANKSGHSAPVGILYTDHL